MVKRVRLVKSMEIEVPGDGSEALSSGEERKRAREPEGEREARERGERVRRGYEPFDLDASAIRPHMHFRKGRWRIPGEKCRGAGQSPHHRHQPLLPPEARP